MTASGYVAIVVGALVTMLVQSSSVVVSTLTPLAGVGVVTLERVYPMMLGANLGTTSTAILAAFSATGDRFEPTFQIALCHMFFNVTGILIWYPIPLMRKVPMGLARFLGRTTARYRWFAFAYLIVMFFLLPMLIFVLSLPGWWLLASVLIPVILLAFAIGVINTLQNKRPHWLPHRLRNWHFLPRWCRSLEPLDRGMTSLISKCNCCGCCDAVVDGNSYSASDLSIEKDKQINKLNELCVLQMEDVLVNAQDGSDVGARNSVNPNNNKQRGDDTTRSTSSLTSDSKQNTNNNSAAGRSAMTSSTESLSSDRGRRHLFHMKPYGSEASLSSVTFESNV